MAPPPAGPPADERTGAEQSLARAKKMIEDLSKKGLDVSEARGWLDQADEMFRGGLYRTSLIYSGYANDAANEIFQRLKDMIVRVSKVRTRALEMLGKDHRDLAKIDEFVEGMKAALSNGQLEECQELINAADDLMRGSSSPYLATASIGVATVAPSRGYSSCPSCGNIVDASWKECVYCGSSLAEEEAPKATGPAWTTTTSGPLRVSGEGFMTEEKEEEEDGGEGEVVPVATAAVVTSEGSEVDKETSSDMDAMEQVERDMAMVERDLEGGSGGDAPKCPGCGEDIEEDWVKCPVCKTQLK